MPMTTIDDPREQGARIPVFFDSRTLHQIEEVAEASLEFVIIEHLKTGAEKIYLPEHVTVRVVQANGGFAIEREIA